MKKIYFLLAFTFIAVTATSQSLSEKELTGVWQVSNVTSANQNPNASQLISGFQRAMFYFNSNHSFQLKTYSTNATFSELVETTENTQWKYDSNLQTVAIGNTADNFSTMIITVKRQNGKVSFIIQETGVELQVIKPE